MKTHGIRILDYEDDIVSVKLYDILNFFSDGEFYYWKILYSDLIFTPNQGRLLIALEEKINSSKNGYLISWNKLKELSKGIHQEIDFLLIGSKKKELLHRYKVDQEMYETCDFVIEMIDSGFWEVFSKNTKWINQLATKFQKVEFLASDFQK